MRKFIKNPKKSNSDEENQPYQNIGSFYAHSVSSDLPSPEVEEKESEDEIKQGQSDQRRPDSAIRSARGRTINNSRIAAEKSQKQSRHDDRPTQSVIDETSMCNESEKEETKKNTHNNIPEEKVTEIENVKNIETIDQTRPPERKSWFNSMKIPFFCFILVLCLLIDDFRKKPKGGDIVPQERKLHSFLDISDKNSLKDILDSEWMVFIEFDDISTDYVPLLYETNVARFRIRNFKDIWALDSLFGRKLDDYIEYIKRSETLVFLVRNSTLCTRNNELIHIIDLTRQIDLVNIANLYAIVLRKKLMNHLAWFLVKLGILKS
ncbi:hypothetical protein M153_2990004333 [Pseudoloma neurophilia]|uniref:Uncharacterized protein n=1 Tax=Pseudoloma neurophilia TaxID=146866 RepID=A0A0R0M5E1_9MICR|nr:hypothetical protein M153_2990004333 [Pseudoloma neurophilia]